MILQDALNPPRHNVVAELAGAQSHNRPKGVTVPVPEDVRRSFTSLSWSLTRGTVLLKPTKSSKFNEQSR